MGTPLRECDRPGLQVEPSTRHRRMVVRTIAASVGALALCMAAPTQRAPGGTSETFEGREHSAWELGRSGRIVQTEEGRVLELAGPGYAVWQVATGQRYRLTFRYRHSEGTADIALNRSGEPPGDQAYHLQILPRRLSVRRTLGDQERRLVWEARPLEPGRWYEIAIEVEGGRIAVSVDGETILSAEDPEPLPPGSLAFGSAEGSGFAFDDLALQSMDSRGPERDGFGVPSVPAGTAEPGSLVRRLQDRETLRALSQELNRSPEQVVFAAQEAELQSILGARNVTEDQLRLLRMMDIERPEDFLRYAGQEGWFREVAGQWARRLGMKPPSREAVGQWFKAASGKTSRLPQIRALLAQPLPPPAPYREFTIEEAAPTWLARDTARQVPGGRQPARMEAIQPAGLAGLLHVAQILGQVEIKPGEKSYTHEFEAKEPGLYRAIVALERPNGTATLHWRIEGTQLQGRPGLPRGERGAGMPTPFPRVTVANATVVKGSEIEIGVGTPQHIYFWVNGNQLPANGKLTMQLDVLKNLGAKVKKQDPIEGAIIEHVPEEGPIRGTITVARLPTLEATLGQPVRVPFLNRQAPQNSGPAIVAVQTAVEAPPDAGKGDRPWELAVTFEGFPRPGLDTAPSGAKYWSGEKFILWPEISVLCDGELVKGEMADNEALGRPWWGEFTKPGPRMGTFTTLVSPLGSFTFEQLNTTGFVVPGNAHELYSGLEYAEVAFETQGGKLPSSYVAELTALEVSTQSEPDDDADDDGDGEFTIDGTYMRVRTPNAAQTWEASGEEIQLGQNLKYEKLHWPTWGGIARIPTEKKAQGDRYVVYPQWAMARWTDQAWQDYDRMGVSFSVVEEDSPTGWQSFWSDVKHAMEFIVPLGQLVYSCWKLDAQGVASNAVKLAQAPTSWAPTQYDDMMGFPAYGWSQKTLSDGLKDKAGAFVAASPVGASEVQAASYNDAPGGWATAILPGANTGRTTTAWVRVRQVPTYWVKSEARLLSFTLSQDLDSGEDAPTDVAVVREPIRYWPYAYGNPYIYKDPGHWGGDPPVDLGSGYAFGYQEFPATANQRVTVDPDKAPEAVADDSPQYACSPCFYVEWNLYDQDPGTDDPHIFQFTRTFYYVDFLDPEKLTRGWYAVDNGKTQVKYSKEGPLYVGHFKLNNPGGYLKQLEVKVYVRVWEG
jgi:hypothetical protein